MLAKLVGGAADSVGQGFLLHGRLHTGTERAMLPLHGGLARAHHDDPAARSGAEDQLDRAGDGDLRTTRRYLEDLDRAVDGELATGVAFQRAQLAGDEAPHVVAE